MEDGISHVLVPKHSIASETEVREVLERLGKPVEALPVINSDDPAISSLNARAGDVIRIDRISPVTEKVEPFYRLVVEPDE